MGELARFLILFGLISVLLGATILLAPRIPYIGRLPGDLLIHRPGTTIYVPLATSLVVSLVLTFLLNLFWR